MFTFFPFKMIMVSRFSEALTFSCSRRLEVQCLVIV
jgi:hypothetical protein